MRKANLKTLFAISIIWVTLVWSDVSIQAATRYVPIPYATIQAAIDEAESNDVVIVADGTYTGDGNRDINFKGKAITVKTKNGAAKCIIDCQGMSRGFKFVSGEGANSILDGFTVKNGSAPFEDIYGTGNFFPAGGGVYCKKTSPTIANCAFNGNYAQKAYGGGGGGIYCSESSPTITSCTFNGNGAASGGGIYCSESSPTITRCTFNGNGGGFGGGVCCSENSNPTITGCTFSNNAASGLGRTTAGGGVYCSKSNPTIRNCTFSGNGGGSYGGGVCCSENSPTIMNCTFSGNTAQCGGGVSCGYDSSPTITNCTFSGNKSVWWMNMGGGVYSGSASSPMITSCILYQDRPQEIWEEGWPLPAKTAVHYSDVESGWAGDGNIDVDPQFVKPGYWDDNGTPGDTNDDFWVGGDYHLRWGSACIDRGDPGFVPIEGQKDIDGEPRVMGSRVDMGVDEVGQNCEPVISSLAVSQRRDGSRIVDIRYGLYDSDGDKCCVSIEVSSDGGTTWTVPTSSATGDIGPNIIPDPNRHIVWDPKVDAPGQTGCNFKVRITVDDGNGGIERGESGLFCLFHRQPMLHAVLVGCKTTVHKPLWDATFHGNLEAQWLGHLIDLLPNRGAVELVEIQNDDPNNLDNVLSAIRSVSSKVESDDIFLFFETGHGRTGHIGDDLNETKGITLADECLVLTETPESGVALLIDNQLTETLRAEPKLQNATKIIVLTGCYTGGFWGGGDGDLDSLSNIALIAGAPEDRTAQWWGFGDIDGSALGSNLIKALTRIPAGPNMGCLNADTNFDHTLTYDELKQYVGGIQFEIPSGSEWRILGEEFGDPAEFEFAPVIMCSTDFNPNFTMVLPTGDLNTDGKVDFIDFSVFAANWLDVDCNQTDRCSGADLDKSRKVDIFDLGVLSEHWLEGTTP